MSTPSVQAMLDQMALESSGRAALFNLPAPAKFKVYKYDIHWFRTDLDIDGPHFRPLSVGCQNDQIVLWAEVEALGSGQTKVMVECVNTGGDVPPGLHYLGTVTTSYGIVWHVYTERP